MIPSETHSPIDCSFSSGKQQLRVTALLEIRDGAPYLIIDPGEPNGGLRLDPEHIAKNPGDASTGYHYKQTVNFEISALTELARTRLTAFLDFYRLGHPAPAIRDALKACSPHTGHDIKKLKDCMKYKLGSLPAAGAKVKTP